MLQHRDHVQPARQPVMPAAPARGVYLTDGTHLYRELGLLDEAGLPMVLLENCHSLDILLVTAEQRAGLTPVSPRPAQRRRLATAGAAPAG
jgi:hypothetical protein